MVTDAKPVLLRALALCAAALALSGCGTLYLAQAARGEIALLGRHDTAGLRLLKEIPMKRFHVHAHVDNLAASIAFYSRLFGAEPARVEVDYAKWMLDDPCVNFAISTRGSAPGIDHLGIQADTPAELAELQARATAADAAVLDEGTATCCYARSQKHWVTDPQGIAWEHFHTLENIPLFNEAAVAAEGDSACCPAAAPRGRPVGIDITPASSCC